MGDRWEDDGRSHLRELDDDDGERDRHARHAAEEASRAHQCVDAGVGVESGDLFGLGLGLGPGLGLG